MSEKRVTRDALVDLDAVLTRRAAGATPKDFGAVQIAEAIRFLALALIFVSEGESE